MIKYIFALWLLIAAYPAFSSGVSEGGGDVGNGGGFVNCGGSDWYNYDYILTSASTDPNEQNIDFQTLAPKISAALKRLNDPLASDFDIFVSTMFSQITGRPYQWFIRKNLGLLYEPGFDGHMPPQCGQRKQAVYYFAPGGLPYASYTYDPMVIAMVQTQRNGNLQISYLWVHEWLWNHFSRSNFVNLARFNRLLHSDGLSTISVSEYNQMRPKLDHP